MAKAATYKEQYIRLRQSRKGLALCALCYALIAYGFASLAIDTASYWYYLGGFVGIGALVDSLNGIRKSYGKNNQV